jgi:hypothetical protein
MPDDLTDDERALALEAQRGPEDRPTLLPCCVCEVCPACGGTQLLTRTELARWLEAMRAAGMLPRP